VPDFKTDYFPYYVDAIVYSAIYGSTFELSQGEFHMRFGKYSILNEKTNEVLTRSIEHGIMTIEHITEFVDTDVEQFGWLEADLREAKKYLEKRSPDELNEKRYCSVCGVTALKETATDIDTCANCAVLNENIQRAFIALRSTILEQNEMIEELRQKLDKNR
jgi:hypothetical protein